MTTKTTHTPLPWKVERVGDTLEVCRDAAQVVCMTSIGGDTEALRRANYEFIVRAVNSHYDLLAALRVLQGWWETSQIGATMSAMGQQADYHKALRMARAAIAKAERGVE